MKLVVLFITSVLALAGADTKKPSPTSGKLVPIKRVVPKKSGENCFPENAKEQFVRRCQEKKGEMLVKEFLSDDKKYLYLYYGNGVAGPSGMRFLEVEFNRERGELCAWGGVENIPSSIPTSSYCDLVVD